MSKIPLQWNGMAAIPKIYFFLISGDQKLCVEIIPDDILTNDLTNLMAGLESSTFVFDVSTKKFSMRRLITVTSLSPETLQSFTHKFIQVIN